MIFNVVLCDYPKIFLYSSYLFIAPITTDFNTLSLHDALPISTDERRDELIPINRRWPIQELLQDRPAAVDGEDRKSTRLNSSHRCISYAVFCLKKKTNMTICEGVTYIFEIR